MTDIRSLDGQTRNADGLLVDEYSDTTIEHEPGTDALDNRIALTSDTILKDVAMIGEGIQEMDVVDDDTAAELLGDGGRRVGVDPASEDDAAEAHSADDLERLTIGEGAIGRAARRVGTQLHGEEFLDSPDREPIERGQS